MEKCPHSVDRIDGCRHIADIETGDGQMTKAQIAYAEADAAFTAYFPIYQAATDAYRAMKIGDAEYLAARKIRDELMAAFDVAFAAVQDEPEAEEVITAEDDGQIEMFA
jgi:hypothetical protein